MYHLTTHYRILPADLVTPIALYLRLRDRYEQAILLESADYHSRQDAYTYICGAPVAHCIVEQGQVATRYPDGSRATAPISDVPAQLQAFLGQLHTEAPKRPFMTEGLLGYNSYEAVQHYDSVPVQPTEDLPELRYDLYRFMVVIDHYKSEMHLIEHCLPGEPSRLDELERVIHHRDVPTYHFELTGEPQSDCTDTEYEAMVARAKAHCKRGDVFQMVLSRRYEQSYRGDDFEVYRALRRINPSPYLFYFDYGSYRLFGSSPEAQLTVRDGVAGIHPIAGTYRRSGDEARDRMLADALRHDPKEQSEHVMLVDLARNDLNRSATDVTVETFAEVQYFSHVIHLVSKVTGRLDGSVHTPQVAADTFPAGTLSGAPKHRAMQLIADYERSSRGYYGGAIGYLGLRGDYNHAIMIRSFYSRHNTLTYRAGAGIVIDSEPAREREEVTHKLAALRRALGQAHEWHATKAAFQVAPV